MKLSRLLLLAAAFAALLPGRALGDDGLMVLWWQAGFDEDDFPDLSSVEVQRYDGTWTDAEALGVAYARIHEITTDSFLPMITPEGGGSLYDSVSMDVPMVWQADMSGFASSSPERYFVIELGNFESGNWSVYAVSQPASYTDLNASGAVQPFDPSYNPTFVTPWNPVSYVVPEPTSGTLLLFGCLMLALQRRRMRGNG